MKVFFKGNAFGFKCTVSAIMYVGIFFIPGCVSNVRDNSDKLFFIIITIIEADRIEAISKIPNAGEEKYFTRYFNINFLPYKVFNSIDQWLTCITQIIFTMKSS